MLTSLLGDTGGFVRQHWPCPHVVEWLRYGVAHPVREDDRRRVVSDQRPSSGSAKKASLPQQEIELILLRQWASYMAMPVWIADSKERLLYFNEPAEVILGLRFDEAPEITLEEIPDYFSLTTEDGTPLSWEDFPPTIALREHRPAHRRLRGRGRDGIWRTVEVTAFPLEGQAGRSLGAVSIFWEAEDE